MSTAITGKVLEEQFPLSGKAFRKRYFMFRIYEGDKLVLESGRFGTEEDAQRGMDEYLKRNREGMFGDQHNRYKRR